MRPDAKPSEASDLTPRTLDGGPVAASIRPEPKWQKRLAVELSYRRELETLSYSEIEKQVQRKQLLSLNYDTRVSIRLASLLQQRY